MTDKLISSDHIQKLGHKIVEIRERAIFNIISKLDNGILFDNDLARCKELLTKLLQWFCLEPCTQEEVVFTLLRRILTSQSGRILINHYGKNLLQKELCQIRSYIEPQFYIQLDELSWLIDQHEEQPVVPPLQCDVSLSCRTGTSSVDRCFGTVCTTASPLEGYVEKETSVEQQTGLETQLDYSPLSNHMDKYILANYSVKKIEGLQNCFFKWQPLIEPDRHVLHSVEHSLRNPPEASALLNSCEFFINVLLHDFPAEIFLQRPTIVLEFYSLLTCGSSRITNAILDCLSNLTNALFVRINHNTDVSMQNLKLDITELHSVCNTPKSLSKSDGNEEIYINEKFEKTADTMALLRDQLPVPKYCFLTLAAIFKYLSAKQDSFGENKLKKSQVGINMSLLLLEEISELLCLAMMNKIWDEKQTEFTLKVIHDFKEMMIHYGDILEYYRVESITSEVDLTSRVVYLYLIHNCANLLKKLVPDTKGSIILPRNLKKALSNSLLDVTLEKLYPDVHGIVLHYVKSFCDDKDVEPIRKYEETKNVCQGIIATVRFLKQQDYLDVMDNIKLAKAALPSIEFHKNFDFLKLFVDICSAKFIQLSKDCKMVNTVEEVVLGLLFHNLREIKEEMYRLCHKKVVTHIGPKLNMSGTSLPGSQILFLISSKILSNISAFGMTSDNSKIGQYAEDILVYIIKSQVLVSESIWNKIIQALIPSLPILACHANKKSALGKTIITLMDPDTAVAICIPPIVMLKCNIQFLFASDAYLRNEAISRICWLMTSQESSRKMLPKFNTFYDTNLSNVCHLKTLVDINKIRHSEHFYQPSSLHQVMEILNSKNVEPVLRRSALNQVSVMMEDPLLHQIFLDSNGVEIVIELMKSSLTEQDYRNYADSIVPIVSILKNISLYHSHVREALSVNMEIFYSILRGLFLFFMDERMKQDVSILLFLLIFKDFIMGSPSKATFSLPDIVCKKMLVPFQCNTHWKVSEYTKDNLKASIISDFWCLSSIQIQWNLEISGSLQELMEWNDVNCEKYSMIHFVEELKLSNYDLRAIKASSISYCIEKYLNTIQNGTSHTVVLESINDLTLYIQLYRISKNISANDHHGNFLHYPWEQSFVRFIGVLPSCEEDLLLLKHVIKLFTMLVPFYKAEKECWIVTILKDNSQCLLDLLSADNVTDEYKSIGQQILNLISVCILQEKNYLDYYIPDFVATSLEKLKPWSHIIKIITENLRFGDAQHFYSLAYLDSLLSCLMHLTATLGWTANNLKSKEMIFQMITILCELVGAFHCGKGPSAAVSVMGLSITRHVLLILNHLLAELQNSKVKNWEEHFIDDADKVDLLRSFLALWSSRDIVLRAAALQFFGGLAECPRAATVIINEVKLENGNIWQLAIAILVDHSEASVVRENAAYLLSNLAGHMLSSSNQLPLSDIPPVLKENHAKQILGLLEEYDFYNHLDIILNNLFTLNISNNIDNDREEYKKMIPNGIFSSEQSLTTYSDKSENNCVITTPALIKAIGMFLCNIIHLSSNDISDKLQELGLVKLLFGTLCNPSISISNTKELSMYCDLLQMNITICSLLNRLASCSSACFGTILHTRDYLNVLMSLLNHKLFHIHMPQLFYLRNKLWVHIFNLITILMEHQKYDTILNNRSVEGLSIISAVLVETGSESFFETLCESICCLESSELQNSALSSLISLLKVEIYRTFNEAKFLEDSVYKSPSLQCFLDSVRTPRTFFMFETENNENPNYNISQKNNKKTFGKSLKKYKTGLLEEAYFVKKNSSNIEHKSNGEIEVNFVESDTDALMAGAEICKILLYLYDICSLKIDKDIFFIRKKAIVLATLTSLLCISNEAKNYALRKGLMQIIIKQLREYHIRLSLEPVESLKRVGNKKKICPVLKEVNNLIGLLMNFMIRNDAVKDEAAVLNLSDIIHKLWIWFLLHSVHITDVLRMLCTYTTGCTLACQTMSLTNAVAGSGPRKTPNSISLLHAIINLIAKEMDQVSKTHDLSTLKLTFNILHNCCDSAECRSLISKSNIFQSISRLHPAMTKRQKPWESIELLWLEFLDTFTTYPEGQTAVAKIPDVLELIMSLTSATKLSIRLTAMLVLRNLSFYHPNRPRLLNSGDFMNILQSKLVNGSIEERNTVVEIIWGLAANNQKAKIVLKSAQLDLKLQNTIKHYQLLSDMKTMLPKNNLDSMYYVLNLLRDGR